MDTVDDADRCVKYLNRSVLEGWVITVEKVYLLSNVLFLWLYFLIGLIIVQLQCMEDIWKIF